MTSLRNWEANMESNHKECTFKFERKKNGLIVMCTDRSYANFYLELYYEIDIFQMLIW